MSRNFTPDHILIDRLTLNDTDALEELYRRYWYSLYVYCLKKLHSSEDAKVIVRDLFIDLWDKRHSWDTGFSLSRHFYGEVRKAVIRSLNRMLASAIADNEPMYKTVPDFRLSSLQQARMPVNKTVTVNKNYN